MPQTPQTTVVVALVALLVVAGAVVFGAMVSVRAAVLVMAGIAFLGAAARLALPATRVFSVRRRAVDVSMMLVLAAALAYLGLTTPLG
ncbi:DUF3017 domain-containing protein [Demequina sp. NBRC 110053]|uniref:DUF3017 domain-containing protein n=1 Tax=Demequina sp. NBRC 110053 TaxID=1570342 RepID=UPI000A04714F|nr:DUF3017 domain-containing protein [Demequina sp. NBRC 110053]